MDAVMLIGLVATAAGGLVVLGLLYLAGMSYRRDRHSPGG